ncbi:MAG: hypothetical protein EOP48_07645 [Sphingobacteriales bacterium]|nr:MAG: hypothetical protein EOP48_07645 [Sphingobacteriales bacterium]
MSANTTKWNIYGKKQADTSRLQFIEIKESDQVVGQGRGHDPYGIAIDAPLAVQLIRDLWKRVHEERVNQIAADMNFLINDIPFDDEKAKGIKISIQKLATKAQTWLDNLLHCSFALTIDKGLLLKMLSQPGCEGVRLYLCLNKESEHSNHLSIVSVGVDIDAKDLNYSYDPANHNLDSITFMENESFTDEYAYSLKKDPFDPNTTPQDIAPYVLFKYANHVTKYPS